MTRLLFLGLNYAPEEIGIGLYSSELIESWIAAGHKATVVCSVPYYPQWKSRKGYGNGWTIELIGGAKVVRCPIYIPSNPTGLRRLVHHLSFAFSAFFPMLWQAARRRPDVVMTVAPSLMATPLAWLAAKLVGARSWLHVQDFEVEAAAATKLVKSDGWGIRLAALVERAIFRRFDIVSSISPQMCMKLVYMGVDPGRVVEIRNWADLDAIRPLESESPFRNRWSIVSKHIALYSGTIGNKQGIEIVLEAARLLTHRSDLTFVICGEGPNRSSWQAAAAEMPNVRVFGLQPREDLSDLLGLATVHLLPQREGTADTALPSKLTNMLASGRPIIATASPGTGVYHAIEGVGIATEPENAKSFALAIDDLTSDPDRTLELGVRARQRAEECWDRSVITAKFVALASMQRG